MRGLTRLRPHCDEGWVSHFRLETGYKKTLTSTSRNFRLWRFVPALTPHRPKGPEAVKSDKFWNICEHAGCFYSVSCLIAWPYYGDHLYRDKDPESHIWTFLQAVRRVGRAKVERPVEVEIAGWHSEWRKNQTLFANRKNSKGANSRRWRTCSKS